MEIINNEFDILDNEFDLPEPNPLDNIPVFLMVGNAQYYLDEHYKNATKPKIQKIGAFLMIGLKDIQESSPLLKFFSYRF